MSYSMRLEDSLGTSPDATLQMRPRSCEWTPDEAVAQCSACGKSFGFWRRKHHCRACGRIYCYECSDNRDELPRDLELFPSGRGTGEWLQRWAPGSSEQKAERTCDKCHVRLQRTRYVWDDIRVFDLLGSDVPQLRTLSLVCKRWCRAALVSLSAFREIQYRLPVQALSTREQRQLWLNRAWLGGHSAWVWQLLRAYPHDATLPLVTAARTATCAQLMCTGRCAPELTPCDALYLLIVPSESAALRAYAIERIDTDALDLLLPHLVHALRYELPGQSTALLNVLLRAAKISAPLQRRLFWLLRAEQASCYAAALQRLLSELDCDLLQRGLVALREMPCETRCTLPVLDEVVLGIQVDAVKTKSSASRPQVWPCRTAQGLRNVLCKTQEVRSDLVVLTAIKYMDALLKADGLDLGIVTYEVMPTGPSSGCIAMVEAETVDEIQQRGSLLNYLLERNPDAKVAEVRARFVRSTAAYCVITYLLGIGDRHLENIMMTRDGRLFHVDFGFLLGDDPKPYAAPAMRLSEGMVEAIGGPASDGYREFQALCTRIYNCLRRHVVPITTLLLLVPCSEEQLRAQILARFVPGESRIEAQLQLSTRLEDSRSSLSAAATDLLHQTGRFSLRRLLALLYEES
jgi:hypothetical protein